jgi:aryl-phospho-beta-D-glucosidase BglC (GH1 family)
MRCKWIVVLVVLAASTALAAQSRFVRAEGKYLVTPDGKHLTLRGTNLGNWLEPEGYMFGFEGGPQSPREIEELFNELIGPEEATRFWQRYRDAYVTEEDIKFLRDTGSNSIRIPFHYKLFLAGNEEGLARLDKVIGWAHKYGLYVILDMHCAPGGQTGTNIDDSWGYPWLYESAEDQQLTIDIWKRIAAHYHDNPTVLGYDLLNEPIPHFPQLHKYNAALEPLYKRITAAVRQVDKNHVVIFGGAQWDSNFDVFGPPFDKNAMYTFHKYWTDPTEDVIKPYLDYQARYNVPLWLGESGENTDEWVRKFTAVIEKDEISWSYWPYKKMDATSSFVAWEKPLYWNEVVAFAKTRTGTGNAEKQIAARPSLEHSRAALDDLLVKIQLRHCRANSGYLGALGLKTPAVQ